MIETPHPRIGVAAVIINRDGRLLVGKRGRKLGDELEDKLGAGTLQIPGGHLEYGEQYKECAQRETLEETGLKVVADKDEFAITNNIFEAEKKHYAAIFMRCTMIDPNGVPLVTEPDECEWWKWMSWDELKEVHKAAESNPSGDRLFLPLINLIEMIESKNMDLNAYIAYRTR